MVECDDCYDGMLADEKPCPSCGKKQTTNSASVTSKFGRQLASPEWQRLWSDARRHLNIESLSGLEGARVLIGFWSLSLSDDTLSRAVTGQYDGIEELESMQDARSLMVEVGYVASVLASWLGTSSVSLIVLSLLTNTDPDSRFLKPARRESAANEFAASHLRLIGYNLPRKGGNLYRVGRKAYLRGFVSEDDPNWELLRIHWNRSHPGDHYDSTEAFRKACERAQHR